jgi:hypothetical protein
VADGLGEVVAGWQGLLALGQGVAEQGGGVAEVAGVMVGVGEFGPAGQGTGVCQSEGSLVAGAGLVVVGEGGGDLPGGLAGGGKVEAGGDGVGVVGARKAFAAGQGVLVAGLPGLPGTVDELAEPGLRALNVLADGCTRRSVRADVPQDRDFMAQDEQFRVHRRLRTRQQHQPPGQPGEHHIQHLRCHEFVMIQGATGPPQANQQARIHGDVLEPYTR